MGSKAWPQLCCRASGTGTSVDPHDVAPGVVRIYTSLKHNRLLCFPCTMEFVGVVGGARAFGAETGMRTVAPSNWSWPRNLTNLTHPRDPNKSSFSIRHLASALDDLLFSQSLSSTSDCNHLKDRAAPCIPRWRPWTARRPSRSPSGYAHSPSEKPHN